uniref:Non-specific serine/threonine protein kinase n=1 Tax=Globodera rostochiensis TaxID=31243 RepID=A0A914H3L8_GLORO
MAESMEEMDRATDVDREMDKSGFRRAQFDLFKHNFLESFDESGYATLEHLTLDATLKKEVVNMARRLQKARISLNSLPDRAAIEPESSEYSVRNLKLPEYSREEVEALLGRAESESDQQGQSGDKHLTAPYGSSIGQGQKGGDSVEWLCQSNEEYEKRIEALLGAGELLMNEWHEIKQYLQNNRPGKSERKAMVQNLQDLITALFDCSFASQQRASPALNSSIARALASLGAKQSNLFLSAVHTFLLQRGTKLAEKDKAFIFRSLATVLAEGHLLDNCNDQLEQQVLLIVNLSTQEMSMAKSDVNSDSLASATKEVLVTLGGKNGRFINQVMDALLNKFQPGSSTPPHKFVILTMAEIAQKNACGFVPFLHDILARIDALLGHVKVDSMRSAFCQSICAFAESVNESVVSVSSPQLQNHTLFGDDMASVASDSIPTAGEVNTTGSDAVENFADQFEKTYDVVLGWTGSAKDSKCRADAAECVGTLCLMIAKERVLKDLKKLDSLFRSLHKKAGSPEEQLAIVRGIANFLQTCCPDETLPIDHYLNDLFELLFPHVCVVTEQRVSIEDDHLSPNMLQIKIRNEVFRSFQVSSCRSADKEIYFILHKMQSPNENVKLGAINLLRHLLNSADVQMKENRSLITMGLKPFLVDEGATVRVKMSLCQLCVSLADNEYVQADEGGQQVMHFLLNNLIPPRYDPYTKRPIQPPPPAPTGGVGEGQSLQQQLHVQCAQALSTIANTSKSAHALLWPLLLEYVCLEHYAPVIGDIFKCLRILCAREKQAGRELDFNFGENPRLPGPVPVMSRLLVCMNGAPLNAFLNTRATEAFRLFVELANWFHEKFVDAELIPKLSTQMLAILEDFCGGALDFPKSPPASSSPPTGAKDEYVHTEFRSIRAQRWQAAVLEMLCTLIEAVDDQEWRESLAAIQAKQLGLFSSTMQEASSATLQPSHDKAFLMRCLGCTLARVHAPQFITEHLSLLFRQTQHGVTPERVGCAQAMGHCAASLDHADLVLTELENIAKWEHTKKGISSGVGGAGASGGSSSSGGGILSYIRDYSFGRTVDAEVLNLRSTLVLSYGYVVFYCPPEGLILRLQQTVLPFLRQYTATAKETIVREAHLETLNLIALSVHSNRIRDYKFEPRYECLTYVKTYLNEEKSPEQLNSWIRLLGAKAAASLVLLEPPLSDNEFFELANSLILNIFSICRERSGLKTLDPHCALGFPHFTPLRQGAWTFQRAITDQFYGTVHPVPSDDDAKPTEGDRKGPIKANVIASASKMAQPSKGSEQQRRGGNSNKLSLSTNCPANGKRVVDNGKIDDDEASTVMEATIMQCRNAIGNLVQRRPFVEPTLVKLLKIIHPFYGSEKDHERARAVDFTVLILHIYSENAADCSLGVAKEFTPLSHLLGRLCPRLCDSLGSVRLFALRAIWLAFKLSLLHRGHSPLDTDLVNSTLFDVGEFVDAHFGAVNEGRLDSNKCRAVISAMAKEVERWLPQNQVQMYISALFKMLSDRQSNVSSAAAQLLTCIISVRGHLLQLEAEVLFNKLLDHLGLAQTTMIQTYSELLNGFNLFSAHHQYLAIHVLLKQPLPYKQMMTEVWMMMARDHVQFVVAIDYIVDLLRANASSNYAIDAQQQQYAINKLRNVSIGQEVTESSSGGAGSEAGSRSGAQSPVFSPAVRPHFEFVDLGGGTFIKVVSSEACALLSALTELIKKGEPEEALLERVPLLLATLLQVLAALVDTQYSSAQKHAVVVLEKDAGVASGTSQTTTTSSMASTTTTSSATSAATTAPTAASVAQSSPAKKGGGKSQNPSTSSSFSPPLPVIVTAELTRLSTVPANLVASALKALLSRIGAVNVVERMNSERAWTNILNPQHFTQAIASFARAFLDFRPHFVGSLMAIEAARLESGPHVANEAERISATAVLSALITKSPHENGRFNPDLFVTCFQALEKALRDPNLTVRKLAIHGLGHTDHLRGAECEELLAQYVPRSIDAALAGLDDHGDRQDQLACESIAALDRLVAVSVPSLLVRVLPQLLLKVRPCFEKENAALRASAFSLFAGLGSSVGNCETFRESLQHNMMSIVLHLNDEEETVQRCCAKVLHTCASLLNSEHAAALVEQQLVDGKVPLSYADFLRQFGMILPLSFPDRLNTYALDCNNYFRSQSARIRQNAAMLIGFMLTALTPELRGTLSKDLIFSGLEQLLRDPDEDVRVQTVSAIALLYAFA